MQAAQPAQQQQKVTYAATTQLQPGIKTQFFTTASIAQTQKPAGAQQIQVPAHPPAAAVRAYVRGGRSLTRSLSPPPGGEDPSDSSAAADRGQHPADRVFTATGRYPPTPTPPRRAHGFNKGNLVTPKRSGASRGSCFGDGYERRIMKTPHSVSRKNENIVGEDRYWRFVACLS